MLPVIHILPTINHVPSSLDFPTFRLLATGYYPCDICGSGGVYEKCVIVLWDLKPFSLADLYQIT